MKSMITNLLLLTMGFTVYSCNEKISAELESGNSTTVPTIVPPDNYYFRVTNQSPAVLNYVLHRTGPGNAKKECAINSPGLALSSDLYIGDSGNLHDSKIYDITCFMEAEELALDFNGLDFQMEASKNTCEYVAYSPYSYFDNMPGATTAAWYGVTCDEGISSAHALTAVPTLPSGADVLGGPTRVIGCGEMVDTSITTVNQRLILPVADDAQPFCAFDHITQNTGSENCDSGSMTFNLRNISDVDPDEAAISPMATPVARARHSCGGNSGACVAGAIKSTDFPKTRTRGSLISSTVANTDYKYKYSLPKTLTRAGNYEIVNYRRGLASPHLNFINYNSANYPAWADTTYNTAFDPILMETYAANMTIDTAPIVDLANVGPPYSVSRATYDAIATTRGWTARPLAAEPFLGLGASRVSPFYTFYCLDRAQEIKARIRMVVRDWDRVFSSTSTDLELLSDVYKNVGARRQDLPNSEQEVPNDPGDYNRYNDTWDWDAFLAMERTNTPVYNPGATWWRPSDGWWQYSNFPNQGPPANAAP